MATEKTTGCRAVDYGDQVAGLHNVCDGLVGAVAEGLDEHSAAGFISHCAQLRLAGPGQHRGKGRRRGAHAMTGQTRAGPAHPVPSKPEQPA